MGGSGKAPSFRCGRSGAAWGLVLALAAATASAQKASGPVRVGVLASRGPERCLAQWSDTAEYLTGEVPGCTFVIRPLSYHDVSPAVQRGEVDFVLVNPSLYVELERLDGASRIATLRNRYGGKPYTVFAGAIFCKAGRPDVHTLRDLRGKSFMGVEEDSFGGWQMAWRELEEHGIDPDRDFRELRFGETHDAVVYAVRDGSADAGTVRADTLPRMAAEGKIGADEFRVIGRQEGGEPELPFPRSTRIYPEWAVAKTRHTTDELAQQVAVALLKMPPESPAAQSAGCAGWVIPQNYQPVHECLKELRIGPYRDYGKVTLGAAVRRYWPWLAGLVALAVLAGVVSVYVTQLNRRLRFALAGQKAELAERIRAEEALRQSEQLRTVAEKLAAVGRLAAGVAHEINNPLTGVLTFAHLLREKENMDDQDREDLDLIARETSRAAEIVHGLLDFARERPPSKGPVELNEVVRRTLRLLGSQKVLQHVTVEEDLAECLAPVDGDVNQLQQVLLNLCLNACEAMPAGGTLAIRTWAENGRVLARVSDTGCGIKPEHLGQIFEPFFSTKPTGKGTGLGLSVSYGIVQEHGGSIEVQSEPGRGTAFTVVLPRMPSEPRAAASQTPDETCQPQEEPVAGTPE